jgi:hypothetical protein
VTHRETGKIGTVNPNAWHFGPEDLVKSKSVMIVAKRAWTGLLKSFRKFKIALLEAELQVPKLQLKLKNHALLNRS